MDCEEYLERMSAALDGALSAGERRALDRHLAACPRCAALFEELSGQSAALRGLDCQLPPGLHERLTAGLPRRRTGAGRWRRWGALAACLALAVGVGVLARPQAGEGADGGGAQAPDSGWVDADLRRQTGGEEPSVRSGTADLSRQRSLRLTWGHTPAAPSARVIGDREELADFLAQFPLDELGALADDYAQTFDQGRGLLAVVVEAGSGSVGFSLVDYDGERVTVKTSAPEVGTDDMAAWLLLAEVDLPDPAVGEVQVIFTQGD